LKGLVLGQQNSGTWVNLASATTWGDLQDFAERLDPERIAMVIDKGRQNLNRRSSSAWAKKSAGNLQDFISPTQFLDLSLQRL